MIDVRAYLLAWEGLPWFKSPPGVAGAPPAMALDAASQCSPGLLRTQRRHQRAETLIAARASRSTAASATTAIAAPAATSLG